MARNNGSKETMLMRANKETIILLKDLKNSMGEKSFDGFIKNQHKTHYFFKNIFKLK